MDLSKPGLYDLDEPTYRALPHINKSGLDKVHRSPAHYRWSCENKEAPTPAMILGQAVHLGVFQPELLYRHFYARPEGIDARTKDGKEKLAELERANAGKTMLKPEDFATVEGIMRAVRGHKLASQLISGGRAEVTALARDAEFDVDVKAKPDYLRDDDVIVDLKTSAEVTFFPFRRSVTSFRYNCQAAWYLDVTNAALGREQYRRFILVAVEKEPPFGVIVYELDAEAIRLGRMEIRADLEVYARCLKSDSWPSYPESILTMTVPVFE